MDSKITALGLEPEMAAKVDAVFKEILKDSYVPIARFNEVNDAKKNLETQITERDNQIAELGQSKDASDSLKKEIEKLQAKNIEDQKKYQDSLKQMKTDKYITDTIMENGIVDAKFIPAVRAYLPSVDIDSEDSKLVFSTKLGEVKTTTLPTMFKSDKGPDAKVNGFHPNDTNTNPVSGVKDDGSYGAYLKIHGYID